MGEKKYLKWYNKLGYGSGDLAGNIVYAFLSSFVMLYLTNTVGLNPGIIGTLIMVSKLFDGISDMFFGTMYSCTSFGTKIGGGIGVALCGWLLEASGFVKESAVQPESCLSMLYVMYMWIPMILSLCITFIMSKMNVEEANQQLKTQIEVH
ncbi:MFS transporter [Oribacterium sinus]